ncbi:MAG: hypothetical protein Q8O99_06660 [bacterium]|nr:hypothetical protein [bacterium]
MFIIFPQVFSDSGLEEEYINESEIIPILSETQDSMDEIVVDINDPEVNTPPES